MDNIATETITIQMTLETNAKIISIILAIFYASLATSNGKQKKTIMYETKIIQKYANMQQYLFNQFIFYLLALD